MTCRLTTGFIERVRREGTVDNGKFRYISDITEVETRDGTRYEVFVIKRLPREYLDTTRAYTDWRVVYRELLRSLTSHSGCATLPGR